jgi:hypothetical protein
LKRATTDVRGILKKNIEGVNKYARIGTNSEFNKSENESVGSNTERKRRTT